MTSRLEPGPDGELHVVDESGRPRRELHPGLIAAVAAPFVLLVVAVPTLLIWQATSFAAHAVHGLATVTQADEASCYKGGCSQGVQVARPGFPGTTFFSFEYVHGRSRPLLVGDVLELSWVPDAPDDLQPYPPPTALEALGPVVPILVIGALGGVVGIGALRNDRARRARRAQKQASPA